MRVLLVHPEDDPQSGPWAGQRWDAVFDLGRAGWSAYARWERAFGCPVRPVDEVRRGMEQIRRVREVMKSGLGQLVDREGLDWWELTILLAHERLERLVLLSKVAEELGPDAEVSVTRDGFEAQAFARQFPGGMRVLSQAPRGPVRRARHYLSRLGRLPAWQVAQILGDKYDTGYRVRRHLYRRPKPRQGPLVLLPSAYVNVSAMLAEYARLLPDTKFLLVCTRRSARLREAPGNVEQEWLAAYAVDAGNEELRELLQRWERLRQQIDSVPELAALSALGGLDDFPRRLKHGLAIRNAWRSVLDSEPAGAVFCGDDTNPYTHIPLLLAARRGLPTLSCHHGGLDGRFLIKNNHADVILAKGRMEEDYLVNVCGIDGSVVEVGAPSAPMLNHSRQAGTGEFIVFFSEPYEMSIGRTLEIYRDLLPGLVELAARTGKKLVVKLHPSENLADRQEMAAKALGREKMKALAWETGRLRPELLDRTWFGVTVLSSVVLDCAVRGVPCFLCEWLDLWPYGYVAQYRKFEVAMGLGAPEEIGTIPEVLANWQWNERRLGDVWQAITPERLKELLSGVKPAARVAEMQRAQ